LTPSRCRFIEKRLPPESYIVSEATKAGYPDFVNYSIMMVARLPRPFVIPGNALGSLNGGSSADNKTKLRGQ